MTLVACAMPPPTVLSASLPQASAPSTPVASVALPKPHSPLPMPPGGPIAGGDAASTDRAPAQPLPRAELYPGRGALIAPTLPDAGAASTTTAGDITLNFEAADLREVIKFILSDLLGENYLIDSRVQGQVTLQTSRPLARTALLPMLENLLRMNNAALVREAGIYRIVPVEGALRGASTRTVAGYTVRIVPLRYIAATEMQKILNPFLPAGGLVHVDSVRNLLILAGHPRELAQLQEMVDLFDVNWLEGMSVGLFRPEQVDVKTLAGELETLFGETSVGPLKGLFRLLPIERLNAILVITPQPDYLEQARVWIDRLDRVQQPVNTARLHVYRMQHGRAEDIAAVLSEVFTGQAPTRPPPAPELRPGLQPLGIGSGASAVNTAPLNIGEPGGSSGSEAAPSSLTLSLTPPNASDAQASGASAGGAGNLRIVADKANNALLIMATPADYAAIEAAIRQLDIAPLQVLVDATIVEITLTDELSYGLQWFFEGGVQGNYSGRGRLSFDSAGAIAPRFPGFNYSIVDSANNVRAVLNALAVESKLNVLSSPSVMVLDNQEAIIKVGDQVPIRTSESTRLDTDQPVTTSSIGYRDTGVILKVNPRVNAGGMVILDIDQEVNDVSTTSDSGSTIDSPTITQRKITSAVAVQSGETIVLGGLIRETRNDSESGIPGLHKIPVLGVLFGQTSKDVRRTELIVLLTPRVASNVAQAREITEEFRRKLDRLMPPGG